nr:unnamed protein product [Callosobruchus chinensis]
MWFVKVLPVLDDNCIIVLDNAPYRPRHLEKVPAQAWTKSKTKEWLESKNIQYEKSHLNIEFLKLVQENKRRYNAYVIDEISKTQNKIVLRLPPYHCQLHPLELIWSDCKDYVASNNTTFKMADLKNLFEYGLRQIKWKNGKTV